jgi:CheY-like chemotaxis protein
VITPTRIPGTSHASVNALPPLRSNASPAGHGPNTLTPRRNPLVLLVDNDRSVVDVFTRVIGSLGIHVVSALDGRRALAAVRRDAFNLWLLETKLPDLHGLDVVRELRADGFKTPFIVVSGSATVQTAVEATKLGAWGVLEKPVRLSELRNMVSAAVASTALDCLVTADPHTPSERWCNFMIGLITAEHDIKTDMPWAKHVGVSLSLLRDCCRRVGVKVEDARNFGRALRAMYRCGDHWTPETVLDIGDARTLKRFEQRSGMRRGMNGRDRDVRTPTLQEFFERQEWLPRESPALLALRALLMGRDDEAVTRREQFMLTDDSACVDLDGQGVLQP